MIHSVLRLRGSSVVKHLGQAVSRTAAANWRAVQAAPTCAHHGLPTCSSGLACFSGHPENAPTYADFEVPESLIAQTPADPPDSSRLMVVRRQEGTIEHKYATRKAVLLLVPAARLLLLPRSTRFAYGPAHTLCVFVCCHSTQTVITSVTCRTSWTGRLQPWSTTPKLTIAS